MRILPLVLLLAACGGRSDDPVVILQQQRDPALRRAFLISLLDRGPDRRLWRRLLEEPDRETASMAAAALRQGCERPEWKEFPDDLVDALLSATARKETEVRVEAILALSRIRADDPLFPPKVLGLLGDPEARVRRAAVQAFRNFGPATAGMDLSPLGGILAKEPELALDAALALAACGDGSPPVVDGLASVVEKTVDPGAALQAARALATLGPRAGGSAARLAKRLPGAPERLAGDLADALGQCGTADPAVVSALEKALGRREPSVAVAAAASLARLGKAGPDAEGILSRMQKGPLDGIRASEGLLLLGKGPGAWTILRDGTAAGNPEAALALARLAAAGKPIPPDTRAVLETASNGTSIELRRAAVRALAAEKSR